MVVLPIFIRFKTKKRVNQRQTRLWKEFKDVTAMMYSSTAAGGTLEKALRDVRKDMLVSAGRYQVLLPEFENFEVYIDSPLAVEATSIFNKSVEECFDEDARALVQQGINPIGFPGLKMAITSDESKMINFNDNPKVIISASGMCEAGRIRHHLKHNLWRKDSTILFVGYQVPGTLGFSLLNGAKEVRLFGETIEVAARIENLPGISGHADVEQLTKWAAAFENKPKKVFVVHGEDKVTEQFADHLKDTLGYETYAPFPGDAFDLATGEQVREGSRERAEKKITEKSRASSNVFARLLAAGQRLLTVINKCEGMPNKELGKFADQINALCNKWDR
jgi:metallo-beta-lactamase family protein